MLNVSLYLGGALPSRLLIPGCNPLGQETKFWSYLSYKTVLAGQFQKPCLPEVNMTGGSATTDTQLPTFRHFTARHFMWFSQQPEEADVNIRHYLTDVLTCLN